MIHSLSFSCQWKMKKETFEVSLLYRRLWIWSIDVSVKTVGYFHTILLTGFIHLKLIKHQQYQGQNYRIYQRKSHLKPPWICSFGACLWYRRNLQNIKKFGEICFESHTWEQLKEVGCSYLPSFMSLHSLTTFKTSLMKRYCVLDSQSGAGGQNSSVPSDSESGAGGQKSSVPPDSELGAGLNKLSTCMICSALWHSGHCILTSVVTQDKHRQQHERHWPPVSCPADWCRHHPVPWPHWSPCWQTPTPHESAPVEYHEARCWCCRCENARSKWQKEKSVTILTFCFFHC